MTNVADIRDLSVRYGTVRALDDVSLSLVPGRVTGLLGMNGSGKSTLFAAIMGRVRPTSGRIELFGDAPARARRSSLVAFMPQAEDVDWDFPISVREVVMTGRYGRLGPARRPHAADRAAVTTALERVGLASLAHRQIGELSGGQRKRVFVARAIAQEARLLLLDEPFAGVDTGSVASITQLLRELADDGRSILVSTHDLGGVPELCDDVVLLRNRVIFHGPTEEALAADNIARVFGLGVA